MSEAAESLCSVCFYRSPRHGSWWCGGCYARVWAELAELAYAHWWLGRAIATPPAAWKSSGIHTAGGSRPPFRLDLTDMRTRIEQLLREWSRRIAYEHMPALAGPADTDPTTIVRWLHARLPWVSEQGWCGEDGYDELAADVFELRALAHGTAPWEGSRRDLALPCPGCTYLSLREYSGHEWAVCTNRECGRLVDRRTYRELAHERLANAYRAEAPPEEPADDEEGLAAA